MSIQDAAATFDMKIGHIGINGDSPRQAAAWALPLTCTFEKYP